MKRLLVSACLLGQPVRYDGADNAAKATHLQQWLQRWQQEGRIIAVCPESLGGLPTPRTPAEATGDGQDVLAGTARVICRDDTDVTAAFIAGAQKTLEIAQKEGATLALLAARSPSCGKGMIYDGSFTRTLTTGNGVTVALLEHEGIRCFTPDDDQALIAAMESEARAR